MKINAEQLSFILRISKKDAKIKILRALRKDGQEYKESDHEFHPNPSADVSLIEKYEKIALSFAIEDIKTNALKRPGYKKYLLYDYPSSKLSGKRLPKKVSLPPALKSLLSKEDLVEIEKYWNDHFENTQVLLKP